MLLAVLYAWLSLALAAPVDFTGTWQLDLSASDHIDTVLELQGRNRLERAAMRKVSVVQTVSQTDEALDVKFKAWMFSRDEVIVIGQAWRDEIDLKGTPIRTRAFWDHESPALTWQLSGKSPAGQPLVISVRRTLEDPSTMVLQVSAEVDGEPKVSARRVFRRVE